MIGKGGEQLLGWVFVSLLATGVALTAAPGAIQRIADLDPLVALGVVQLGVIMIGWITVYRLNLRAQQERLASQIRVDVYRDLTGRHALVLSAAAAAQAFFARTPSRLARLAEHWTEAASDDLLEAWDVAVAELGDSLSDLTRIGEPYRAALGDLTTIAVDLSSEDLQWQMDAQELLDELTPLVVHDRLRPERLPEIAKKAQALAKGAMRLATFAGDFRNEAQNQLLAPLFAAPPVRRKPAGSDERVLVPGDPAAKARFNSAIDRFANGDSRGSNPEIP